MDFIITGTHAYGPINPKSDLDIVVKLRGGIDILHFLENHNIKIYRTPSQDSYGDHGGFYFDLAGIKVNIIVAEDELILSEWSIKTEKMKRLPAIPDRDLRVRVFNSHLNEEEIKSLLKKEVI